MQESRAHYVGLVLVTARNKSVNLSRPASELTSAALTLPC
jgi:hypothetical protein